LRALPRRLGSARSAGTSRVDEHLAEGEARCESGAALLATALQGLSSPRRALWRRRCHRPSIRHDRRLRAAADERDRRALSGTFWGNGREEGGVSGAKASRHLFLRRSADVSTRGTPFLARSEITHAG